MRLHIVLVAVVFGMILVGMTVMQSAAGEYQLTKIADDPIWKNDADALRRACGEYFVYYPESGPAMNMIGKMTLAERKVTALFNMRTYNVETRIDNSKDAPTVEPHPGPKFIIRLKRSDYEKAKQCLPSPISF